MRLLALLPIEYDSVQTMLPLFVAIKSSAYPTNSELCSSHSVSHQSGVIEERRNDLAAQEELIDSGPRN